MQTQALEGIGFTDGEIRVYLALLELGETSTGDIIKNNRFKSVRNS
jgi:sugar-specific transcriptional regulator TrmB